MPGLSKINFKTTRVDLAKTFKAGSFFVKEVLKQNHYGASAAPVPPQKMSYDK